MKNLTMKIVAFRCLTIMLVVSLQIFAQSRIDSTKNREEPLSLAKFFEPSIYFEEMMLSNELTNLRINSNFMNDSSSIWIRTRMFLNSGIYQETIGSNVQSNILNPLYEQYIATQNMKLFRSILGAVSVGTAGYLAYKHVRKYGFIKKR